MDEQQAVEFPPRVRGWILDGASVIEAAGADGPPMFFVLCGGRWARCRNLEAAIELVWDQLRTRAHLPPQWALPDRVMLEHFNDCWTGLRQLSPGQWWPAAPEHHAPSARIGAPDLAL